jgi:hypothetical protein
LFYRWTEGMSVPEKAGECGNQPIWDDPQSSVLSICSMLQEVLKDCEQGIFIQKNLDKKTRSHSV